MSLLLEDGDRPGRAPLPRGRPARFGYYQRRGEPTGSAFPLPNARSAATSKRQPGLGPRAPARTEGFRATPTPPRFCGAAGTAGGRDPLIITKKNVIIAGHRRWEKAKQLELPEVPVVVFESEDEAAILKELIESNLDKREQTTRDKLLEAEAYREAVEAESAKRQTELAGTRRGDDLPEVAPEGQEKGDSRDVLARKVKLTGWTGKTLYQALDVLPVIRGSDEALAEKLWKLLEKKVKEARELAGLPNTRKKKVAAKTEQGKEGPTHEQPPAPTISENGVHPEPDHCVEPAAEAPTDVVQRAPEAVEPMPTGPISVVLLSPQEGFTWDWAGAFRHVTKHLAENSLLLLWTPGPPTTSLQGADNLWHYDGRKVVTWLKRVNKRSGTMTGEARALIIAQRGKLRLDFGSDFIAEEGVSDWRDLKALRDWAGAGWPGRVVELLSLGPGAEGWALLNE
jgi:ParB-like chromosome segregation protein Spo0J